jgi:hypothetical protein
VTGVKTANELLSDALSAMTEEREVLDREIDRNTSKRNEIERNIVSIREMLGILPSPRSSRAPNLDIQGPPTVKATILAVAARGEFTIEDVFSEIGQSGRTVDRGTITSILSRLCKIDDMCRVGRGRYRLVRNVEAPVVPGASEDSEDNLLSNQHRSSNDKTSHTHHLFPS